MAYTFLHQQLLAQVEGTRKAYKLVSSWSSLYVGKTLQKKQSWAVGSSITRPQRFRLVSGFRISKGQGLLSYG